MQDVEQSMQVLASEVLPYYRADFEAAHPNHPWCSLSDEEFLSRLGLARVIASYAGQAGGVGFASNGAGAGGAAAVSQWAGAGVAAGQEAAHQPHKGQVSGDDAAAGAVSGMRQNMPVDLGKDEEDDEAHELILPENRDAALRGMFGRHAQVSRKDVEAHLGVGKTTANNLLEGLVQEGFIERVGIGRNTRYRRR